MFPRIDQWLDDIDACFTRGVDNRNYSQYAEAFSTADFIRIDDILLAKTPDVLSTQIRGLSWMAAARLLEYAREDIAKLRNGA